MHNRPQRFHTPIILALSLAFLFIAQASCKKKTSGAIPSIDMVKIEGGTFIMGSDSGEPNEKPAHRVKIDTFYLGRTEITVAQWRAFVNDTGYITQSEKGRGGTVRTKNGLEKFVKDANWKNPYIPQTDEHPVVLVSWEDAREFCSWLSEKTGLTYRLPTEAEWEYACRGGEKSDYYGPLDEIAWYEYNSGGLTHPVGGKHPNAFGLYDMTGNVWEWVHDRYDANYYRKSPEINPMGPDLGRYRVSRGGSWCSKPNRARMPFRRYDAPDFRFYRTGFRIARRAASPVLGPSGHLTNR